jgi:hypothetical protein
MHRCVNGLIAGLGLLAASLTGTGCVAAAAGAAAGYGAFEYSAGEYVGVARGTLDTVWHASVAALEQRGATIRARVRERAEARLRATDKDGTSIQIDLRIQSSEYTRVTVRVGVFGDEAASRAIVAKIKDNL